MLRLLRNMKVSTKLITVLAAPVAVLIILSVLGVSSRISAASDAQRIEKLTGFMQVNADLIDALQKESVWSAAYMSTLRADLTFDDEAKAKYKAELDKQRTETDAALARYKDSLNTVDPGGGSPVVQEAIKNADGRITLLKTNRNSVDSVSTVPSEATKQFANATDSLIKVNSSLVQEANDASLLLGLTTAANFERAKDLRAKEAALVTGVAERGGFTKATGALCDDVRSDDCVTYIDVINASNDQAQASDNFGKFATADDKRIKNDVEAKLQIDSLEKEIIEQGQKGNSINVNPETVTNASLTGIKQLDDLDNRFISQVNATAAELASDAQRTANIYIVFTVAAVLAALVIAFFVGRALTVPLRKLTSAAYTLSTDKLPGLVERLRNPDEQDEPLSATLTPIDIDSKDEIGQLADAFNSIQQVTVEVAEEQAQLLRKGIGDIFINLARRNQTLLDRQIEFIDQLEANEEDPDQLDNLFKLDHLATRMRRNAESLLVLAGAEPPRRRGRPVALADVVRVAIGEVEDFARIQLLALDEATVGGNVAVDLAHLLSELMENATHFSPPDTMVEIVGHRSDDGSYVLSVSDQGIGMSADQLQEANVQLSRPPLVGLALSRSLGFIVIGRLAGRFGISVKLTASPSGGVTALVTLPHDVVTYEGQEIPEAPPETLPPVTDDQLAAAPTAKKADVDVVEEAPAPPEPVATGVVTDATDLDAPPPPVVEEEEIEVAELEVVDEDTGEVLVDEVEADVEVVEEVEAPPFEPALESDDLLDELVEEVVPEGDEFERGLQSLVSDELAPGPVEPPLTEAGPALSDEDSVPGAFGSVTTVDEPPTVEAPTVEAPAQPEPAVVEAAPLTAAGLVKRTPKKRSAESLDTSPAAMAASKSTGQSQRSPEEVRKMLSRYRSGLNRGRGGADSEGETS